MPHFAARRRGVKLPDKPAEEKEKDGIKQQFPANGGHESSGDEGLIRYRFNDESDKKLILGKFSDWKLVYRVPGKLVELPIPFEFKDVPLP